MKCSAKQVMGKEVYLAHWSTLQSSQAVELQLQEHGRYSYNASKVKEQELTGTYELLSTYLLFI